MTRGKTQTAKKTRMEALAAIQQVKPSIPEEDYIEHTLSDESKIELIMNLVHLANLYREREDEARLKAIQRIPKNIWKKEHYVELLEMRDKYVARSSQKEAQGA